MTAEALRHLADVEEISIGFTRPDGSTGSTPVWVVQAGDAIFVPAGSSFSCSCGRMKT